MKDPQPDRHQNIAMIAGVALFVAAIVAGVTWWRAAVDTQQPPAITSPQPPETTDAIEKTVNIYWVDEADNQIVWVPNSVTLTVSADQPHTILAAAFDHLLSGPQEANQYSEIPPGTQLLNLTATQDGAIAIDLSTEFTTGGGSASMIGRLGQVVYTATSLDPLAPVRISVNGLPLEVLGGEGLEISQPITRQQFEQDFR
ncbi:MAG: GerMN domain-containing protein [Arthrospira sp. SH-MAG29]|nr:GerMN domain-containing protein [Arthrospira sp. SH-MAG29]MBS0016144.1 GerMN domain-containing protein [Arthrospira sp. SH-MAG29]